MTSKPLVQQDLIMSGALPFLVYSHFFTKCPRQYTDRLLVHPSYFFRHKHFYIHSALHPGSMDISPPSPHLGAQAFYSCYHRSTRRPGLPKRIRQLRTTDIQPRLGCNSRQHYTNSRHTTILSEKLGWNGRCN